MRSEVMNNKKHIRIKSRFRFTAFITILIIMTVVGFNTIFGMNIVSGESEKEYTTVEVIAGQTLWDIASTYMSDDMDQREAVYMLQKENHLNSAAIKPGQKIKVPV